MPKKCTLTERGVSPVVGTTMMIVVTVILSGMVAGYVISTSGSLGAPSALLGVTARLASENTIRLTITNMGGETVLLNELRVYAGASDENVNCIFDRSSNENLEVGNIFSVEYSAPAGIGETVFVRVVHAPASSILFQGTVRVRA
jgi:flagellin-like protein